MRPSYFLFFLLLVLPTSVMAWTPAVERKIANKGAALAPPDLAFLIERNRVDYEQALQQAAAGCPRQHLFTSNEKKGPLRSQIVGEVSFAVHMVRTRKPLSEFVAKLGLIAHLISDANNPFLNAAADLEFQQLQPDFEGYLERRLSVVPTVFYGLDDPLPLGKFLDQSFSRTAGYAPLIREEYFRGGERRSSIDFDDRSSAFGVISLTYSHAVTDLVNVYYHVWRESGGDVRSARAMRRGTLLVNPAPPRRAACCFLRGRALSSSQTLQRAILSVSDKNGIVELAKFLEARGVEILSTGGTAAHLREQGVKVTAISEWSGAPEVFGGRVKTLTPRVFGGILYDRDDSNHRREAEEHAIPSIDVVVVNLYPFEATIARESVTPKEAIEQIDVGGPSMLRAAAKNYRNVLPLCQPSQYARFMKEVESGGISEEFRREAAVEVFRMTSRYDHSIAEFLSRDEQAGAASLPDVLQLSLQKTQDLRYGENPQQRAAFYLSQSRTTPPFKQLHGKELSYNNLGDMDAAFRLVSDFQAPTCAVIKHTNPSGVGTASAVSLAVKLAIDADPVSAFGGVVAVNRALDGNAAEMLEPIFLEVIIAPSFTDEAVERLGKKKNLRLVESELLNATVEVKTAAGGYLIQTLDLFAPSSSWKKVSKRSPSEEELRAMQFAWIIAAHVKSNAIVITRENQSVGVGAGQMSRVDAAKIAIMKAILPTAGTVAASDAFFPFRDGLDVLADAGITAVVQPGGSVRDDEVIAAADERGLAIMFTGERHFRH